MPYRESSSESSSSLDFVSNIETAHLKMKRRQSSPETLAPSGPSEEHSKFLTDTLLIYEIGMEEKRKEVAVMESRLEERLRELEEAESPLMLNQMDNLKDQAILLNERRSRYITEIHSLKSKVVLLGKVAKLIRSTTLPMGRNLHSNREDDGQLHLLRLRDCVEKVGAASQMMADMTLLMARVSAQE